MKAAYVVCLLLVFLVCVEVSNALWGRNRSKLKSKKSVKHKTKFTTRTGRRRRAVPSEIPLRCDFKKYNTDDEEAFISRQEVYDLLSIFDGGPKTEQNVDLIFFRLDTNGDGKLGFEEFYLDYNTEAENQDYDCPIVELLEQLEGRNLPSESPDATAVI